MTDDEDDPVVASYDVYLTQPLPPSDRLFMLQYPSHRPPSKPYNAERSQAPTSLRLKQTSGFLEVDVPLLTHEHYNEDAGRRFGKALSESRIAHSGGSHGLAGGFSAQPGATRLRDVPVHDQVGPADVSLMTQTLGGKITTPSPREPMYLVGVLRHNQLHLSQLDAVVQMRPQLHHIDAEDENTHKRLQSTAAAATPARQKAGLDGGAVKIESKPIEVKIRDTKDDSKDRGLNENARLLRDIQVDVWQHHDWWDEADPESTAVFDAHLRCSAEQRRHAPALRSAFGNGDWLDKMSAPREDGKKGLLAKLRGRERERARRRKAEEEKRLRQKETLGAATSDHSRLLDMSPDSDLSSPDASDSDPGPGNLDSAAPDVRPIQIKKEPTGRSDALPDLTVASTNPAKPPPRKRGRPRKTQPVEAITVDD